MTIITITMIIIFLLGMLAFGSSALLCIIGIIVSAGIILLKLKLIPLGNLSEKRIGVVRIIAIGLMFVLGAFSGLSSAEGGLYDYEEKLDNAMALIQKEKLDEAWEEIDTIKEMYGGSDNTVTLEVVAYLSEGSYDDALSALNGYSNRNSVDYYSLLESIYLIQGSEKNGDQLSSLYMDAAARYPNWTYAQQMAGIAYISRSEFVRAEYHLLRAYEQEPFDYKSAYYLGVTCYEQKRMDDAFEFFQEALDREADEEIQSYIAWYIQEIGK